MPKCDFNKVATHIHDCTDMNMIHHINFLTSYKILQWSEISKETNSKSSEFKCPQTSQNDTVVFEHACFAPLPTLFKLLPVAFYRIA